MKHYTAQNRQEMFNNVWKHYIAEGNPIGFQDSNASCVYRGWNYDEDKEANIEVACAIGIHLPDEYAKSLHQSDTVKDLLRADHQEALALLVGDIDKDFLAELQSHHDGVNGKFDGTNIEERLRMFASLYNLTIPENPDADNRETHPLQ